MKNNKHIPFAFGASLANIGNWEERHETAPQGFPASARSSPRPAGCVPLVMVVNPSLPARTVPEFIAHARTNRGKLSMGSGGNGSTAHMGGELFKMLTGIDMVHVPYRGGAAALTDLIGGQVQVVFSPVPDAIEHIRGGRVRPLAVTTATRSE